MAMDGVIVAVFSPGGRCLSVSASAGMLAELGLSVESVVGRRMEHLCSGRHADWWAAQLGEVYESRAPVCFVNRCRFPTGRYTFRACLMPMQGVCEQVTGVVILGEDWKAVDSTQNSELVASGVSETGS